MAKKHITYILYTKYIYIYSVAIHSPSIELYNSIYGVYIYINI